MDESDGVPTSPSSGSGSWSWLAALLGTAALGGVLAGCLAELNGPPEIRQHIRIEEGLRAGMDLLRLAEGASWLVSSATQLEGAQTSSERESIHIHLRQRTDQLLKLSRQIMESERPPPNLPLLRRLGSNLDVYIEELNSRVQQRITAEGELCAAVERVSEQRSLYHAAIASLREERLPPQLGTIREELDELGRALADKLLLVPSLTQSSRVLERQRAFQQTASRLGSLLDRLPISQNSAWRADAARQLVALGIDPGNIFELAEEHLMLADAASEITRSIHNTASQAAATARRIASDIQEEAETHGTSTLTGLTMAPAVAGGFTALAMVGAGLLARRWTPPLPPGAAAPRPAADLDGGTREDAPLRILLAEDEPFNQTVIASMLRRAGHAVTVVGTGREAIAALEATPETERFDLVLMDLRMPEMDGREATQRIRALPCPHHARVRIIVLTASVVPEESERCLAAGADAVLSKPLRLAALEPFLRRLAPGEESTPTAIDAPRPEPTPVLNEDAIRQMLAHLPAQRIASLMAGTAATLRDYHQTLEQAWNAGDRAAAGAMAHKIAGVSGIYGCEALHCAAQRLEAALAADDTDIAEPKRAVDAALEPALSALRTQSASLLEGGA